jgi:hypothetical protein
LIAQAMYLLDHQRPELERRIRQLMADAGASGPGQAAP